MVAAYLGNLSLDSCSLATQGSDYQREQLFIDVGVFFTISVRP